jgi:hypothetical protein
VTESSVRPGPVVDLNGGNSVLGIFNKKIIILAGSVAKN